MKVVDSSITLNSEHIKEQRYAQEETLVVWGAKREPMVSESKGQALSQTDDLWTVFSKQQSEIVKLSSEAIGKSRRTKPITDLVPEEESVLADLNIRILKALIERLTGKKIILQEPKDFYTDKENIYREVSNIYSNIEKNEISGSEGYGLIYEFKETYQEYEKMDFRAQGVIMTADGNEVTFNTTLSMTRSFIEMNNLTIKEREALKDPLVINYDGKIPEISNHQFSFDIDSDGTKDQLHFVNSGSGFLVVDLNEDGHVNDGKELFGARTGNGFRELSVYDDDGNSWIDENDTIYEKLRIWYLDDSGEKKLISLGQKGIGAIYLGKVDSPFSIKDENNKLQAQIQSTGLFVKENGTVGSVQQIDLVV